MRNTPVIGQSLRLVTEDGDPGPAVAHARDRVTRLALDQLHATALDAFVVDAPAELAHLTADAASALGLGSDRERADARIRLAARMIAIGRVQQQALELSLAAALERRDDAGIAMLNRVLDGVSRRTQRWLEEHRLSCSAGQRSVAVAVHAAGAVTITGER